MSTILAKSVSAPRSLQWWEWGKIIGLVFPLLLLHPTFASPFWWAVAAHLFIDFTIQSTPTAIGKVHGDWGVLAYHTFIAGGWPGFILGGLPGLAVSVLAHLAVDATKKFGLPAPWGPLADQGSHLATLLLLLILF